METEIKKQKKSQIEVDIKLTKEEWQEQIDKTIKEEVKKIKLPGFREGQAPGEMAMPYLDHNKVYEAAIDKAVKEALFQLNKKNQWQLVDQPKIEIKNAEEGLEFTTYLTIFPEIELADYKNIAAEVNLKTKKRLEGIKVKEEEIRMAVDWLLKARKEEGKGDEKKLTDEIAQSIGNFKSAEELKKSIEEGLIAEKKVRESDKGLAEIIEETAKKSKIEVPEIMVKRIIDSWQKELEYSLKNQNQKFEEYIKKHYKSLDNFRNGLKDRAEKDIRGFLVIEEIAKQEDIKPTEEEVNMEINKKLESIGDPKKAPNKEELYEYSYNNLRRKGVFKFLEKITEKI